MLLHPKKPTSRLSRTTCYGRTSSSSRPYNRGEAVAAAARSQDRRIHAANVIKAFFQVATGVYARPSSSSSGSGSESGSDDDDDDDVAAPAPAEGMASARLPFRRHRRGAAVRLPSSSEDSG